jgi:hypothetical protein
MKTSTKIGVIGVAIVSILGWTASGWAQEPPRKFGASYASPAKSGKDVGTSTVKDREPKSALRENRLHRRSQLTH